MEASNSGPKVSGSANAKTSGEILRHIETCNFGAKQVSILFAQIHRLSIGPIRDYVILVLKHSVLHAQTHKSGLRPI